MNRIVSTIAVALALILAQPVVAHAAEIKVWTARAIATVLAEIGPQFEHATGHNLNVYSGLPADFERRANAGNPSMS
jgi:ABC-type molybdate transport system substrate-binding protein